MSGTRQLAAQIWAPGCTFLVFNKLNHYPRCNLLYSVDDENDSSPEKNKQFTDFVPLFGSSLHIRVLTSSHIAANIMTFQKCSFK